MATCVDSIQPISTGLYASYGIVPRVPVFTAIGNPRGGRCPTSLATSWRPGSRRCRRPCCWRTRSRRSIANCSASPGPQDHQLWSREGRRGVLIRHAGDGAVLGYGYVQASGRLGPVALLDDTLYPAVLGSLVSRSPPPGPYFALVPGVNHRAMVALLRAGLRFEGFPGNPLLDASVDRRSTGICRPASRYPDPRRASRASAGPPGSGAAREEVVSGSSDGGNRAPRPSTRPVRRLGLGTGVERRTGDADGRRSCGSGSTSRSPAATPPTRSRGVTSGTTSRSPPSPTGPS